MDRFTAWRSNVSARLACSLLRQVVVALHQHRERFFDDQWAIEH
ncbi:hypothetical protein NUH87_28715 [Pseudomonas batumici]